MSELAGRGRRSDRGRSRLAPALEAKLQALLDAAGLERPGASAVSRELAEFCRRIRVAPPSRGSVYNALTRIVPPSYARDTLPEAVQRTLHNVGGEEVPGSQIVFAAFNYGDTSAISYAAGLPWSCLYVASRLRGWRPKSRALLRAVTTYRRI